ncbi:MAG: polysaccharide deacetylase [Blautia sp.]|nr:polysaccharide deacetylase [Blautia sp.]
MNKRVIGLMLGLLATVSCCSGCRLLPFEDDQKLVKKETRKELAVQTEADLVEVVSKEVEEGSSGYDYEDGNDYGSESTEDYYEDEVYGSESTEDYYENVDAYGEAYYEDDDAYETEASDEQDVSDEKSAETVSEKTIASELDTSLQGDPSILREAKLLFKQYDYDGCMAMLKSDPSYSENTGLQNMVAKVAKYKASCIEYPLEEVTHVFYHILVKDVEKAFDGDSDSGGYNQYMTTIDEFNKITQIMYDKGYVMVSPHDMATVDENGVMSRGSILLPPGKIPFVLSQDDTSYYHYMDGDGFASRLVLDENGDVKCEYIEDDGSVSYGNYDMVPLIDAFVKEHPDFSYHGRKGILALTGYNGVLGYRTDIAYKTWERLSDDQLQFLESHPDFDYEEEVRQATEVANAMRANGWEFASHTWGHRNATESTVEQLQVDNEKWEAYVAPIVGKTDMIIFAFGADIGNWEPFTFDNAKFAYFKGRGYHYYCNVDSNRYWVQITENCFRQGRRNLDGYRMYHHPDMLSDLFDVKDVWDSSRPTPVPSM